MSDLAVAEVPSSLSTGDLASDIANTLGSDFNDSGDEGAFFEDPEISSVEERATDGQDELLPATEGDAPQTESQPGVDGSAAGGDAAETFTKTADGKAYQIPIDRWNQTNEAAKFAAQLQSRFPSVQEAEQAYSAAVDLQQMETDYLYGQNQDAEAVLNHWMGTNCEDQNLRSQYEQAFQRTFGERLPDFLANKSPDLHKSVAIKFAQPYIDSAYQQAAQTGDADDLFRAQAIDYQLTGKFRTDAAARTEPISPELQAIRNERAELQQMRNTAIDNDWKSADQTMLSGPKWQKFDESIATALKPAEGKFSPRVLGAIKNEVRGELLKQMKSDQDWVKAHNAAYSRIASQFRTARAQGGNGAALKPQIDAHIDNFMSRARQILPGLVKDLVADATAKAVADNQNKREQAAPRRNLPAQSAAAPNQRGKVQPMSRDQVLADIRNLIAG